LLITPMLAVITGDVMKQFFLLLTISITVAASVLVRADEAYRREIIVPIQHVEYLDQSMTVKLSGYLTSPCLSEPRPGLSLSEDNTTLILDVIATQRGQICAAVIANQYDLAFDVRTLRSDIIALNLNPDAQYKITTRDGRLSIDVDFNVASVANNYTTQQIAGNIFAVENSGKFVVVVSPELAFEVKSPFIEMAKYVGAKVTIQGRLVSSRKPGAIFDHSLQPLAATILLTGINTSGI